MQASDEEWRSQYDAIDNLRILNKYHTDLASTLQDEFAGFICTQIDNLRSNNSRNALNFVLELFKNNNANVSDAFAKSCLPLVFVKTQYDKKFISEVAKDSIRALVLTSASPAICELILEGTRSKNVNTAEFAVEQLVNLVKNANPAFYEDPVANSLISAMCAIIEGKKPRMVKNAVPVLQEVKSHIGEDRLTQRAIESFTAEESKEDEVTQRVQRIMASIEPQKKVDKSKDFRSFIKSQASTAPKKSDDL